MPRVAVKRLKSAADDARMGASGRAGARRHQPPGTVISFAAGGVQGMIQALDNACTVVKGWRGRNPVFGVVT